MAEEQKENPNTKSYPTCVSVFAIGVISTVVFLIGKLAGGWEGYLYIPIGIMVVSFILAMFFAYLSGKEGRKHLEYIYVVSIAGLIIAGIQLFSLIPIQTQN